MFKKFKEEMGRSVHDCSEGCRQRELSDEKRDNVKGFEEEAKENSSKAATKGKVCGVQDRNHSRKLQGKLQVSSGEPRV